MLWLLVKREFRARYAGSTLGVFWNIIHPLVLIGIYILVFSNLMANRAGGGSRMEYAIHLTAGIIPWFFFSEVVMRSTTSLVDNAAFLKKLALPEEVLHVSVFLGSLLIHAFSLAALAVILACCGVDLGFRTVFVLPVMLALGAVALGLGMFLSVLHLVLRDIGQLVNVGLQFVFWLTPIVYPITLLDPLPGMLRDLPRMNPIMPYIALIQRLFGSHSHGFLLDSYWLMALLPFLSVMAGLSFLRKHRSEILDHL
ncbi:ABC transporter permease [Candidatus Poribacteria bacterium]|nr:ABC transporter permease [Candidatus Poribacteria bacterium]